MWLGFWLWSIMKILALENFFVWKTFVPKNPVSTSRRTVFCGNSFEDIPVPLDVRMYMYIFYKNWSTINCIHFGFFWPWLSISIIYHFLQCQSSPTSTINSQINLEMIVSSHKWYSGHWGLGQFSNKVRTKLLCNNAKVGCVGVVLQMWAGI